MSEENNSNTNNNQNNNSTPSPPPQNPKVLQLKEEWENLSKDFERMKEHSDQVLQDYTEQLYKIRDQKMKQVEEWKENEIKCANTFKQGQIYAIDCDYEQRKIDIQKKVKDLTIFKAKILKQEFPEAFKYFTEQGYDFSFLNISNEPEKQENDFVDVEESKEKLLTDEQVQEDLEAIKQSDDWRPEGITMNARITIEMPNMPPLVGTVCSMSEKTFELKLDNGKIIQVSNLAINSGTCKLVL